VPSRSANGQLVGGVLIGLATAIVILAVAVIPFLSPAWVGFEQDRAQAPAWTGYSDTEIRAVTGSILVDLVTGQGDFGAALNGAPVLSEREQSHMRDVRGVFDAFGVLALLSLAVLVVGSLRARNAAARDRLWTAVRRGARGLAVGIAVVGVVAIFAFDAAFEVFHRLFFAVGTYDFDPRTSRLVQLFPDQFWSETTMVVGLVGLILALAVGWFASRRLGAAARRDEQVAGATVPASGTSR
jgi:integral membrane protein (TIGR01906 family)